jgi:hypothetical protein
MWRDANMKMELEHGLGWRTLALLAFVALVTTALVHPSLLGAAMADPSLPSIGRP